ncbi:MAG TPA: FAD-binding oxidoreductase [Dehalococcoidia bacterium]|nr:FAD-binding oxidoreductase [Dehalococcoidia bacterium]
MAQGLPQAAEIVIIGGGAVGCSIAYHLAKHGQTDVVVLERDQVGSGSTSKAAGGIRAQFSTAVEIEFSLRSIAFFERFEDEMEAVCDYRKNGYLYLLTDEADRQRLEREMALQRQFGVDVRLIAPEDVREIVAQLRVDDLVAAVWSPNDGYAGPNEVVQAYARQARRLGAKILEGTPVTGLRRRGDRVTAVETPQGVIEARLVVNAAGPQAGPVGRLAGLDVPIAPRRRHIFATAEFSAIRHPSPLVFDRGSGFYFRTDGAAILMSPGDTGEAPDCEPHLDWRLVDETVTKAIRRVPALADARVRSGWAGLRPLTPDDHAIVDFAPGFDNLFCAIGFCGHGFQHSPAAGQVVAAWLTEGRPPLDLSALSFARFAGRDLTGHPTPSGAGETPGVESAPERGEE